MTNIRIVSSQETVARATPNLDELTKLVNNVAHRLQDLKAEISFSAMSESVIASADVPTGFDLRHDVRNARKLRHLRRKLFGEAHYSGPAWDILLHLFDAYICQRRETIGNVTDGAELPGATALRWISRLEASGLIALHDDHLDRRRRYVELSAAGTELMTRYFTGAAPHLIAA